MPLYKRTPFTLLEKPDDLKPNELVFQLRFTKEIFRDYGDYLKRINLYRQRAWTCKFTGKTNLTYEEALVSEKRANEKVQQFPTELVEPVLRDVQFSMLSLRDLVSSIATKLQDRLLEGTELYGRKNNRIYPCKIVKVLEEGVDKTQYQVAWLDKDKKVTENAVVNEEDLIKKLPFARDVLKSFIRESTWRNVPWVLHDKLARKHGISTDPPEELKSKLRSGNGSARNRKRKTTDEAKNKDSGDFKRNKLDGKSAILTSEKNADEEDDKRVEVPIKYPIDDLLVEPDADDPAFTLRPSPCREFSVPMDCVGDLLMVWNFCSSFGRILNLSPFSLEDFENSLCHKDSSIILIVEAQSALLRLLIKDEGDYYIALQKKKRKLKITLVTWTDYLCDFLEMISVTQSVNLSTIRRGHYGILDIHVKLGIFRELVEQAFATDIFREQLDKLIEERQALSAANREEALEEGRKRREEKELSKVDSNGKQLLVGCSKKSNVRNSGDPVHNMQNGDVAEKQSKELSAGRSHRKDNSSKKQTDSKLDRDMYKQKEDAKLTKQSKKTLFGKVVKVDNNEAAGRSSEQRKENLEREMERRVINTNPLGKDRDYNRYWFFRRDARIFIESSDSNQWGYYSTRDEVDSFIGSLNPKGERERALKKQLEKHYDKICWPAAANCCHCPHVPLKHGSEIQKRSKEVAHRQEMEDAVVRRSTRVRAPPRENPALAFLHYVNKLKEE